MSRRDAPVGFDGFKPQFIEFLTGLAANNNREWFQAHYAEYQAYYLEPAQGLVVALGERLRSIAPDVHAEPKVRGSIFNISRDVRFTKDKSPYKVYLDLWLWQGSGPSRECPGYFLRLEPARLTLGAGMHGFADDALARYRRAVADAHERQALLTAINGMARAPAPGSATARYEVGGQTLKRIPSGFQSETDPDAQALLRYTGLYASTSIEPLPAAVFSAELPAFCFEHFGRVAPLQEWLVQALNPALVT